MKIAIVALLVCLAGLACAQSRAGMPTGMAGMGGAAAGGNSNLRSALAMRMLAGGRGGGAMSPGLQMLMLSQGMFESPMEMMLCQRMGGPMCTMMLMSR